VIRVFRLSIAWCITPPFRPRVVMCATLCDILSHLRSLCFMKILVTPQALTTRKRYISPCLSRIYTSWTMCAKSGISVPPRYWLNLHALVLSRMTFDFSDIRWGWTSSIVAISACMPNFCIPSSILSNLPCRARYQEWYAIFLLTECCCTVACARVVECVQAYSKVSIGSCNETCRIDIRSIDD